MSKKPFYITTAISYVNGVPHLGHAYEAILTDVIARFRRLEGRSVLFLTGTDDHGQKVEQTAKDQGIAPEEFADTHAAIFQEMDKSLCISNDDFVRTTQLRHIKAAQSIWKRLEDAGAIYLGKYEGWYSVREEAYFTKDEVEDGLSPNGTPVEWVVEPSYFFRLSEYSDKLLKLYSENPSFIEPKSRRNELAAFVGGGLHDLSISRHKSRLNWGIEVPSDSEHVMYVWLDALTNYLTGAGYPDNLGDYWPCDAHVIGKDITRFHGVYWPAFLMAAGLPLPRQIFAHGFINIDGVKMSKSLGNVVSPDDLLDSFGVDGLRYLLMREVPHGQDGSFNDEHARARLNSDLSNGIGNLAQRTLTLIYKNCDESIPQPSDLTLEDEELLKYARFDVLPKLQVYMDDFAVHKALFEIMALCAKADCYIDENAPWKLAKTDTERMKTVLYVLADVIRCAAICLQPVVPNKACALLDQLSVPTRERDFASLKTPIKSGVKIEKPQGLFPRLDGV